jgi:hypothetical protein
MGTLQDTRKHAPRKVHRNPPVAPIAWLLRIGFQMQVVRGSSPSWVCYGRRAQPIEFESRQSHYQEKTFYISPDSDAAVSLLRSVSFSSGHMGSTLMGSLQPSCFLTGTFGYSRQIYVPLCSLSVCVQTNVILELV